MEQNKDQGGAAVRGEAVAEAATDQLYGAVMNIPCTKTLSHFDVQSEFQAYKIGHRDARHAAADLIAAFSSSARAADAPSKPSEAIERIFESWDGCDYDGIDIGAALRADFKNFVFGKSRAADALDSQPTDNGKFLCAMEFDAVELGYAGLAEAMAALRRIKADPGSDREALIACLGDDAATLSYINPDDEMAQTMREAIAMLESDEVVIATLGMASSQPTDGGVRNG